MTKYTFELSIDLTKEISHGGYLGSVLVKENETGIMFRPETFAAKTTVEIHQKATEWKERFLQQY